MTQIDYTKAQFASDVTTQKIYLSGSIAINGTSESITHGLGYIPFVRVWAQQLSGEINSIVTVSAQTSYHDRYLSSASLTLYVTATTLVLTNTLNGPVTAYYRIYLDA